MLMVTSEMTKLSFLKTVLHTESSYLTAVRKKKKYVRIFNKIFIYVKGICLAKLTPLPYKKMQIYQQK